MSPTISANAERGAHELVEQAEQKLRDAIAEKGAQASLLFSNTVYYLPIALGLSSKAIEKIGDLEFVLEQARTILQQKTTDPALEINTGVAALLAAEVIEALQSAYSPIPDLQVRTWGVQLADARIPGVALLLGCARNNAVAVELVEGFRRHNILCFLSGSVNGSSIINQLQEEGFELGNRSFVLPLGSNPTSAVHVMGFTARCAMKLGGHKPGTWHKILEHSKRRAPGFVLALGELDNPSWAMTLAAQDFGFSLITDMAVPDAKQIISMPFESITGPDDIQKAMHLVEQCILTRGLKLREYSVSLPVAYSPAFEDEVICDSDLYVQFGGTDSRAFELLQTAKLNDVMDGKVDIIGPDLPKPGTQIPMDMGLVVKVAGKKLQSDFEPYLERQIHSFLSYASGIQHTGDRDSMTIRISKAAAAKGVTLESLGKILHARFHEEFAAAIEKVEIVIITEPERYAEWQKKAREIHDLRNRQLASLTDSDVDEFYVCTNCRSFAPQNVSIISPERVSPCGKCNWLDAKAAYAMNPAGVRRPIKLGKSIDAKKGVWEGTNRYAKATTHGRINEISLYSIMQNPMSACGDFECIVVLIPEANGVMVVAHEDTMLATPAGVTIETFASISAGEQIPGVVGVGRKYLLSPKFLSPEGGFRRVVWMSSRLKDSLAEELKAVCEREGEPDLMNKIADEHQVTSAQELVRWIKEHKHPAVEMERMF